MLKPYCLIVIIKELKRSSNYGRTFSYRWNDTLYIVYHRIKIAVTALEPPLYPFVNGFSFLEEG